MKKGVCLFVLTFDEEEVLSVYRRVRDEIKEVVSNIEKYLEGEK